MHCTDAGQRVVWVLMLAIIAAGLVACGQQGTPMDTRRAERSAPPSPAATVRSNEQPIAERAQEALRLSAPATPRSMRDLQLQFAQRLVAANPDSSYTTRAPDRLHSIPVLEVELHADGSVRRIEVLRKPTTGDQATALAIAAVRRAAPYGNVSRLPRPWKVVETFLFDDQMRFKPRTLDIE